MERDCDHTDIASGRLRESVMGCSIRTERWSYTEWGEGKHGVELYDHYSDPMEFNNLAVDADAKAAAVINRLKPLLDAKASGKSRPHRLIRLDYKAIIP